MWENWNLHPLPVGKECSCCGKQCAGSSKAKHRITIWAINPPPRCTAKEPEHTQTETQASIVTTAAAQRPEEDTTQMSISRWTDALDVVNTHGGISFSLEKAQNPDTCYNMGYSWKHYAREISHSQKDKWFHVKHEAPRISKLTEHKVEHRGLPGGPAVKNPPALAGGFNPWSGKIPHAEGQLSPWRCNYWSPHTQSLHSATREPTAWEAHTATRADPAHNN